MKIRLLDAMENPLHALSRPSKRHGAGHPVNTKARTPALRKYRSKLISKEWFPDGQPPPVIYITDMNRPEAALTIDALLDPVARCFTPETAKALVSLPPNLPVHRRTEELGGKAGEGSLTPAERQEYQALIEVGDVISVLQLKARLRLASVYP